MSPAEMWIWGRRPVLEALHSGSVQHVFVAAGRENSPVLEEMQRLLHDGKIRCTELSLVDLEHRTGSNQTQGIAAVVASPKEHDIEDLLAAASLAGTVPFILVLDQIQDPHNLGALIRTANATGVQGVVLPDRRSAPLSGVVAKSSAGAVVHTPIARVPNLARSLKELQRAGLWLVGLDAGAELNIFEADLTAPLALVIGSEGSGLRRLTRESCDFLVHLPMDGKIESLNAAVAGSIGMYEVVRQRQFPRVGIHHRGNITTSSVG